MRRAMDTEEALRAARRQFGGVTQMQEHSRERRGLPQISDLARDVLRAFRQMRRAKWFTACAGATLALVIDAGTAVFAVLDGVTLRPLPFAEPGRLMSFRSMDRRGPLPTDLSYPNFFDFRAQNHVFEHLVSYREERFTLTDGESAISVLGEVVSWDLFPLLGVQPALGRGFLPGEEKAGTHVVVLGHALWRSHFGADRTILDKRIRLNGKLFRVAGVAPAGFQFPVDRPAVQIWTTLAEDATVSEFTPLAQQRGARMLDVLGRLRLSVPPGRRARTWTWLRAHWSASIRTTTGTSLRH